MFPHKIATGSPTQVDNQGSHEAEPCPCIPECAHTRWCLVLPPSLGSSRASSSPVGVLGAPAQDLLAASELTPHACLLPGDLAVGCHGLPVPLGAPVRKFALRVRQLYADDRNFLLLGPRTLTPQEDVWRTSG